MTLLYHPGKKCSSWACMCLWGSLPPPIWWQRWPNQLLLYNFGIKKVLDLLLSNLQVPLVIQSFYLRLNLSLVHFFYLCVSWESIPWHALPVVLNIANPTYMHATAVHEPVCTSSICSTCWFYVLHRICVKLRCSVWWPSAGESSRRS